MDKVATHPFQSSLTVVKIKQELDYTDWYPNCGIQHTYSFTVTHILGFIKRHSALALSSPYSSGLQNNCCFSLFSIKYLFYHSPPSLHNPFECKQVVKLYLLPFLKNKKQNNKKLTNSFRTIQQSLQSYAQSNIKFDRYCFTLFPSTTTVNNVI